MNTTVGTAVGHFLNTRSGDHPVSVNKLMQHFFVEVWKCHTSRHLPDTILCRSFFTTTASNNCWPGNEAKVQLPSFQNHLTSNISSHHLFLRVLMNLARNFRVGKINSNQIYQLAIQQVNTARQATSALDRSVTFLDFSCTHTWACTCAFLMVLSKQLALALDIFLLTSPTLFTEFQWQSAPREASDMISKHVSIPPSGYAHIVMQTCAKCALASTLNHFLFVWPDHSNTAWSILPSGCQPHPP